MFESFAINQNDEKVSSHVLACVAAELNRYTNIPFQEVFYPRVELQDDIQNTAAQLFVEYGGTVEWGAERFGLSPSTFWRIRKDARGNYQKALEHLGPKVEDRLEKSTSQILNQPVEHWPWIINAIQ